jgi:hypothetical protein
MWCVAYTGGCAESRAGETPPGGREGTGDGCRSQCVRITGFGSPRWAWRSRRPRTLLAARRLWVPSHREAGARRRSALEKLAALIAREVTRNLAQETRTLLAEEFRIATAAKPDPEALIEVHEMARAAGMSERWVYDHAHELGGVKAGGTKRARWRFDRERALALLTERQAVPRAGQAQTPPERRELPSDVELLPVKGRAA